MYIHNLILTTLIPDHAATEIATLKKSLGFLHRWRWHYWTFIQYASYFTLVHTRLRTCTCDVDFMVVGVFGERGPCDELGELAMEFISSSLMAWWGVIGVATTAEEIYTDRRRITEVTRLSRLSNENGNMDKSMLQSYRWGLGRQWSKYVPLKRVSAHHHRASDVCEWLTEALVRLITGDGSRLIDYYQLRETCPQQDNFRKRETERERRAGREGDGRDREERARGFQSPADE